MNNGKKHIVILGGGFAGVATIKTLLKKCKEQVSITLVDQNSYHLFTPSLYEVATREIPQKNIVIPFRELFGIHVHLVQAKVLAIDPENKSIKTDQKTLSYDYLVFALGSEPSYHHIPGLEEHSIPLKTLDHAMHIQKHIASLFQACRMTKEKLQVVIGGGGFAGCELAAELLTYKRVLEKVNTNDCVHITLIHGSNRLLPELDSHVSSIAKKRLKHPSVQFALGERITKVTKTHITTDMQNTYPYDLFIWTGGVQTNTLAKKTGLPLTDHGQIVVNEYLQANATVFIAGDSAGFIDPKTKKSVPGVAQVAEEEGRAVGENLYRIISDKPLLPYRYRHFGYIVPLKGRFAVAELMSWHFDGFLGWVLQQLVFFRYLLGILPFTKALKRWNQFEMELTQ